METEFCLLNENGEVFGITDHLITFEQFEMVEIATLYQVNCLYQRVHNDIIGLIQKGMILPSENEYPRDYVQNTINYLGELIENELGVDALKEMQMEISETLKDPEINHDLMHNIMVGFNFELHPMVNKQLKNGEL
jgi:hypothetical protein